MTQHEADNPKPQPDPKADESITPGEESMPPASSDPNASLQEIESLLSQHEQLRSERHERLGGEAPEISEKRRERRAQINSLVGEIDNLPDASERPQVAEPIANRAESNAISESDATSGDSGADWPSSEIDSGSAEQPSGVESIEQMSQQVADTIDDQLLDNLDQLVDEAMEAGLSASMSEEPSSDALAPESAKQTAPPVENSVTGQPESPVGAEPQADLSSDDLYDSIQSLLDNAFEDKEPETSAAPEEHSVPESDSIVSESSPSEPDPEVTSDPPSAIGFDPSKDLESELAALLEGAMAPEPSNTIEDQPQEVSQAPSDPPIPLKSESDSVSGSKEAETKPLIAADDPELENLEDALDDLIAASLHDSSAEQSEAMLPVATEVEAPKEVAKPEEKSEMLNELEHSISDRVNDLLEVEPEELEAVLDNIFDEQAIFVEDEPVGASNIKLGDGGQHAVMSDDGLAVSSVADPDEAIATVPEEPSSQEESIDELAGDLEDGTEIVSHEVNREIGVEKEKEVPESKTSDDAVPELETPKKTKSKSKENHHAAPDEGQKLHNVLWTKVEPTLLGAFRTMNWPMRFVPKKARSSVDWVALSLVFWVPVVWVMALFVMGG